MKRSPLPTLFLLTVAVAGAVDTASAQTAAVATAPTLGPPAPLVVPAVKTTRLPGNGLTIKIVEQHELPIVQVTAVILGGSRLDAAAPGIASFTANMLDEGAAGRDAAALQAEIAYLGASLTTTSDWDRILISLKVPVRNLAPALDIMADVMLRPTFAQAEVRRQKDLRIANWLQLRDQPNALAALAFNSVVYPAGHPYHNNQSGDSTATAALDSAALRAFYDRVMRPDHATFIAVGDVTEGSITSALDKRFAGWTARGPASAEPNISVPPLQQSATHVYLVDKPSAAQSVITIGWPGVDRRSPDYAALMVMNTMLGGSFTSRLNMNLRENKGYSYGANSGFAFRLVPGPFTASAAVRTNVTDSSLVEFFNELRAIRDKKPSDDEVERAKSYVELGLPQSLESTTQVATQIANLGIYGFTLQVLQSFATRVRAVTADDVQRVARSFLTPDRATIVVVGDLSQIRSGIDALKLGPTQVIDAKELVR